MLSRALRAGALAGLLVGLGDGIAAWSRLGQFVPGVGGKLHAALWAACMLGLAGAIVAWASAAAVVGLVKWTAIGRLWRHAAREHEAARARDPREALVGLALTIAGLPVVGGALALAYRVGFVTIQTRKHKGLVIAVAMAATIAALAGAVIVTFAVGRLVEWALARLLRGKALAAASHPLAPPVAAAGLGALALGAGYLVFKKPLSLDQLHLRPFVVALFFPAALVAVWPLAKRVELSIAHLPRGARLAFHPVLVVLLLVLALLLGGADGPRKAANAFTGLTGPVAGGLRKVFDFDRDGYSPIFGGGDCNDFDKAIHPGAFDIPDDGVDQNCVGGDLTLRRKPDDARFVERPAAVPADVNVVLITVDALRADHLGVYGYGRPTSPNIDKLGADSMVFDNGWAHAPSTRYSVPAILTGRYPSQVLWDTTVWWPALRAENRTIAEIMHDAGLTTGAFLTYQYFEPVRRMNQGFDHYDNSLEVKHQGTDPAATSGTSAREVTDLAIAWLDGVKDRRFFMWIHYYDPHYRYERHPGTMSFGDAPMDLYDHEIRFTDEQMGRLIDHLREMGVYGKTVIVLTGDHGEGFGEHGITFHGYHLYAAQTRVPMIIHVPGLPPGRATMPVGHIDILPTLANLVGAPADVAMLGRSLLGELARLPGHDPDADRDVYQEVSFEGPTERRAVASKRWHLLYNMVPDNTWELYDLGKDPRETRDVWGDAPGDARALRDRLQSWIDASQFPPGAAEALSKALLAKAPAPQVEARADFGGNVRLLGYDLAKTEVHRGETIDITYLFEALGRLDGDWRLFVHIEGPSRWQDDHVPVDGVYPFSRWSKGQYIADERHVVVPPNAAPGEYTIYVGLWQPHVGNLKMSGAGERDAGNNRLRLGTVKILP
jgi:arylsulfatase A-like enzyme